MTASMESSLSGAHLKIIVREHYDTQGLPYNAEDTPKDDIANERIVESLVDLFSEVCQWSLAEHAEERVQTNLSKGDAEDQFVGQG